jgi:type VII secretion protein EccB
MWSRRDQVQAYQFLRRRTVSAVLTGDANNAESPTKLTVAGIIGSIIVLVLGLAGFGVVGFILPGASEKWKAGGSLIEEKETGARYLLGEDGLLHPISNYASALLLLGSKPQLVEVSRKSLAEVGRGQSVGIPGAPDAVPDPTEMTATSWSICTDKSTDADFAPTVSLLMMESALDATAQEPTAQIVQGGAVEAVIVQGRRHLIDSANRDTVLNSLGLDGVPISVVHPTWLGALPAGPDLSLLKIPARGKSSDIVLGKKSRVGQVFEESLAGSEQRQYFVLLSDGLAPISLTQARLILGDPQSTLAYPTGTAEFRPISTATVAQLPVSATDLYPSAYSDVVPPNEQNSTSHLCVSYDANGEPEPSITLASLNDLPSSEFVIPAGSADSTTGDLPGINQVVVQPGAGALVRAAGADSTQGAVFWVTDQGIRYPLIGQGVIEKLGFSGLAPAGVPQPWVELLPMGPELTESATS